MPLSDQRKSKAGSEQGVCPVCHGLGFVYLDVPMGDPRFGQAIPCVCKRKALQEQRRNNLLKASNLRHLGRMTFDSFQIEGYNSPEVTFTLQDALHTAQAFAANPSGWLVLMGPFGCGKTHLAAAIANDRVKRGLPVLFVVVPDLLDYLRASYAPNSPVTYDERFEQVRNIELLILDDLGTQNTTPWAAEKLYQILNYRHNAELPTVITTNNALSDMDPRLASRLTPNQMVRAVPIYAPDRRIEGKDETFGSLSLYGGLTFDRFSDRRDELESKRVQQLGRVIKTVKEYAENPRNWLLLRGGYGVGKTHLAAAVANRVVRSGMTVLLVVASDLLDHLRATFQPGSPISYDQRFNEVRRAWLLVLDDLGGQNTTPWAQEKLFQILNYRYVAGLPTVLTMSSYNWEHLDQRLKSRVMDTSVCTIVELDIPSYRGKPSETKRKTRRTTRRRM